MVSNWNTNMVLIFSLTSQGSTSVMGLTLLFTLSCLDVFYLVRHVLDLAESCLSVQVLLAPSNTAAEIGKNVTLACIVSNKQPSENVQWKHKPNGRDVFNALTFDDNVLASLNKYDIQWTYNLTIYNLKGTDSGLYRCTAGGVDYDAVLTVIDLPSNVTIQWSDDPKSGLRVNLTCTATHGMPPPHIRWLVNSRDMTLDSMLVNMSSSDNGYSDVRSYLPLTLIESMNGQVAQCILSYDSWESAMKAVYTIQITGNALVFAPGVGSLPDTIIIQQEATSMTGHDFKGGGSSVSKPGIFLLHFLRETAGDKVDFQLQHIP